MKQIIRLTESDLTRIVKRVINEEKKSKQDVLKNFILRDGWKEVADKIGGFDVLYKHAFNNDYNNFLDLYGNLDISTNKEYSWDLYCIPNYFCPFYYRPDSNEAMISNDKLWSFFQEGLNYTDSEIILTLKKWLSDTYGLKATRLSPFSTISPDNPYN